jgi:hypothetical protein
VVVLAVRVEDVAFPLESVVTEHVLVGVLDVQPEEAKVALAPLLGAVKVTETPDTGFPSESRTIATSPLENDVLTVAFCPEPETTLMLFAAPELSVTDLPALARVHDFHTAVTV